LKKQDNSFLWAVALSPCVNIGLDLLMNFSPSLKISAIILRLVFNLLLIFYFLNIYGIPKNNLNSYLLVYILYLLGISMLASNLMESVFDGFMKIAISLLMLPIGFKVAQFDNNRMIKGIYWTIIVLLLNYIFSQFFKLGDSVYSDDTFYKGGATASAPVILSMSILIIFYAFNVNQLPYSKIFTVIASSIAIFIIILSVKRGAILGLAAGFAVYFIFTSKKLNSSFRLLLIGLGLIMILSEYSDVVQKRVDARSTEKNEIQNENRYREVFFMFEEMANLSLPQKLFGYEPFNSSKIMAKYFGRPRQLHVDYTILLLGTGIFGLLIYLGLFLMIYLFANNLKSLYLRNGFVNGRLQVFENFALLSSLIVLSLTMSFSGGIQFLSYRIILFLYIGYSIGRIYFWNTKLLNSVK
jgi:hypothetical protein